MRTLNSSLPLLLTLGVLGGCSSSGGEEISPVAAAGEWTVISARTSVSGCTQDFEGELQGSFSIEEHASRDSYGRPFNLLVSLTDQADQAHSFNLECYAEYGELPDPDERIVCAGETPFGVRPDLEVDAAWPLLVEISGTFTLRVPCGTEPASASWDYAGFTATWTTTYTGSCSGAACDGATLPAGEGSAPLCASSLSVEATWQGCGEGSSSCLPIEADPDLDCP